MKAILADAARLELAEAIAYDVQGRRLGDRFLDAFLAAVNRIEELPEAWHRLRENTRRCRLGRFPYA